MGLLVAGARSTGTTGQLVPMFSDSRTVSHLYLVSQRRG